MTKRLLIDAAHPEEIRVVVADEDRIDDFEVETTGKEQLKGNIYVGEITRVEPSLQAAFIDYGGNRNGFLSFGEIHPYWFDLPQEEKDALLQELKDIAAKRKGAQEQDENKHSPETEEKKEEAEEAVEAEVPPSMDGLTPEEMEEDARALALANSIPTDEEDPLDKLQDSKSRRPKRHSKGDEVVSDEGDDEHRRVIPIHRRYQIQDVVKEGGKILIQVNKEERGNKGAALSTYISLPGRYVVLMPNTPYAGGISRKITDYEERKELKKAIEQIKIPEEMGLIVRTAGVGQPPENIQTDITNLLNRWEKVMKEFESGKKADCVHEDGSLPIRSIRDMFNDDIEEVIISGRRVYRQVKDYMKSLMPESAKNCREHRQISPLFTHFGVEQELNCLHHTRVELHSGGYLIINPTEALVSIDVNSGKATQEKNIEETAFKTNLEAADEVARQLRLRDLAGLVVIDFIDMENRKNERNVERAMRRAVRKDRARIQISPISEFGLLEMSRQRLRPSLKENTTNICAHCNGTGALPSLASSALMLLRGLEEEHIRGKADRIIITASSDLAVYILNHKRDLVRDIEARYKLQILIRVDDKYDGPDHRLDLIRVESGGSEKSQTIEVLLREKLDEGDTKGRKRRKGKNTKGKQQDKKREHRTSSRRKNEGTSDAPEKESAQSETSNKEDTKADGKEEKRERRVRRTRRDTRRRDDKTSGEEKSEEQNNNASSKENTEEKSKGNPSENSENSDEKPKRGRRRSTRKTSDNTTESNVVNLDKAKEKRETSDTPKSTDIPKDSAEESDGKAKTSTRKRSTTRRTSAQPTSEKKEASSDKKEATSKPAEKKAVMVERVNEKGEKETVKQEDSKGVGGAFQRWWSKS